MMIGNPGSTETLFEPFFADINVLNLKKPLFME